MLVGLISHSGDYLLSAAADGCVNIWNATSYKLQHTLKQSSAVVCLAMDHDNTRFFTASSGIVKMWDLPSGEASWETAVGSQVWQIVWREGSLIVASWRDGTVVYDLYDFD